MQTLESSSATEGRHPWSSGPRTFFTERGKKRPWLDGQLRNLLETVGRKSREREGCQRLDSHRDEGRAKTPLRNPGDSAEAKVRVVKRHFPRVQIREPRRTGAVVRSWWWQKSVGHITRHHAIPGSRKRDLVLGRRSLAPKEIPRQLTRHGMDKRRIGVIRFALNPKDSTRSENVT